MLGKNSFHGPLGGCFKMALADALRKKLDLFSFYLTEKENKTCCGNSKSHKETLQLSFKNVNGLTSFR